MTADNRDVSFTASHFVSTSFVGTESLDSGGDAASLVAVLVALAVRLADEAGSCSTTISAAESTSDSINNSEVTRADAGKGRPQHWHKGLLIFQP